MQCTVCNTLIKAINLCSTQIKTKMVYLSHLKSKATKIYINLFCVVQSTKTCTCKTKTKTIQKYLQVLPGVYIHVHMYTQTCTHMLCTVNTRVWYSCTSTGYCTPHHQIKGRYELGISISTLVQQY